MRPTTSLPGIRLIRRCRRRGRQATGPAHGPGGQWDFDDCSIVCGKVDIWGGAGWARARFPESAPESKQPAAAAALGPMRRNLPPAGPPVHPASVTEARRRCRMEAAQRCAARAAHAFSSARHVSASRPPPPFHPRARHLPAALLRGISAQAHSAAARACARGDGWAGTPGDPSRLSAGTCQEGGCPESREMGAWAASVRTEGAAAEGGGIPSARGACRPFLARARARGEVRGACVRAHVRVRRPGRGRPG
jgi:hypothetical protein